MAQLPDQLPKTSLLAQRLLGRLVLITGAGGAIGLETGGRLLQEGANLSLIDLNAQALEAASSYLANFLSEDEQMESRILAIIGDVASEADVESYTKTTVDRFGRLDCAFLNAGISYAATSIFDTSVEDCDKVMRVNVRSGAYMTLRPHFQTLHRDSPRRADIL